MAFEGFAASRRPNDLVTSLTDCPHCGSLCLGPSILPCGHLLCRKCLRDVLQHVSAGCPKCRQPLRLPRDQDLSISQVMENMSSEPVMEHLVLQGLEREEDLRCLHCPNKKAAQVCLDCHEYYCEFCSANHQRSRLGKEHTLRLLPLALRNDSPSGVARRVSARPIRTSASSAFPAPSPASARSIRIFSDSQLSGEGRPGLEDVRQWEEWAKREAGRLQHASNDYQEVETIVEDIMSLGQQLIYRMRTHRQVLDTYRRHLLRLSVIKRADPSTYVIKVHNYDVSMDVKAKSLEKRLGDVRKCRQCPDVNDVKMMRTHFSQLLNSADNNHSPATSSILSSTWTPTPSSTTTRTPEHHPPPTPSSSIHPTPNNPTPTPEYHPSFFDDPTPTHTPEHHSSPSPSPSYHPPTPTPTRVSHHPPPASPLHLHIPPAPAWDDHPSPSSHPIPTPTRTPEHQPSPSPSPSIRPTTTTTTTPPTPASDVDLMTVFPKRVVTSSPSSSVDRKEPKVRAIVSLHDDRLVLTDFQNEKVKVMTFNTSTSTLTLTASLLVLERPWGLGVLPDGLVAMTTSVPVVYLLNVTDDDAVINVTSKLQTVRHYRGIAGNNDGYLIASCGSSSSNQASVDLLTRTGNLIRTITDSLRLPELKSPYYLCSASSDAGGGGGRGRGRGGGDDDDDDDSSHVLVSDCGANTIFKIHTASGKVTERLQHTLMKFPRQVCVSRNGHVLVSSADAQCVSVRGRGGQWRQLLVPSFHVESWYDYPSGLCLTPSGRLVVSWARGLCESMVIIYELK